MTIVTPSAPQIGGVVRRERERLGWTVADLAGTAGVSRAMVTRVERGEANPTAAFLGKLSAAFGLRLSQLIARGEPELSRRLATEDEQGLWVDPESGHLCRQLTPPAGLAIELVEITLPLRARISYPPSADAFREQQIWVLEGTLHVREGGETVALRTRDCYALGAPVARTFTNPGPRSCRYLVAAGPASTGRETPPG